MSNNARKPAPGTADAIKAGCSCPLLNNNGRGFLGIKGAFIASPSCPLHGRTVNDLKGE